MFAPISAIFGLLFFASTLPNGIRLGQLPALEDSVEILAGYASGGLKNFSSTGAAKSLELAAYAAGGRTEFIDEMSRTALRITAPKWALPMLADRLPALFKETPAETAPSPPPQDFREKVEEEIRNALLGPDTPSGQYGTNDAFVLISAPPPDQLREALAAIPQRSSGITAARPIERLAAERTFRFQSNAPEGAVVFASPIPGVYYKQWYAMLLLDRLIRRTVPLHVQTALPLTVDPYYYRVEFRIPAGQFPEPAEQSLLQELQRLQFTRANAQDFGAAQNDALGYLNSKDVREWFACYDLESRREEGIQWVQSLTPDDMRIIARDLLIMNRVMASWAPRVRQTSVTAEPLKPANTAGPSASETSGPSPDDPVREAQPGFQNPTLQFSPHTDPSISAALAERLASGVSIAESTERAVFVSGASFTTFDREFTPDDVKSFAEYRADRILVLAPAAAIQQARQLWSSFKGSATDDARAPKGKVSSVDLPALFVLKTILDLRVIEAGWNRDVQLRIDPGAGSDLQIAADDGRRAQILTWIKDLASAPLSDAYFAFAREIALHRFDRIQASLQALTWDRDPQGVIQGLASVSPQQVQDVARIYF